MDLEQVKAVIALAEEAGLLELEVETEDLSVRVVRGAPAPVQRPAPVESAAAPAAAETGAAATTIRAPMAGTFYAAPAPDAEPFIRPGSSVASNSTVCIIESMKMMNEIRSPRAGTCAEVLVANGTPVETGQPLFTLR
ncbi:MAG: acetyl-CoA carboxylase biotin carboxyl carrier protein [Pseudomonadota bacterium]